MHSILIKEQLGNLITELIETIMKIELQLFLILRDQRIIRRIIGLIVLSLGYMMVMVVQAVLIS